MNVKEDMLKKKKEINEKTEIFIFVFLAFILLTTWAMTQPFNSGPDEQMRYYIRDKYDTRFNHMYLVCTPTEVSS